LDEGSEADHFVPYFVGQCEKRENNGIGWFFISQTLGGIDNEKQQLRFSHSVRAGDGTEFDRRKRLCMCDKRS